jgi:DNA-binding protein H-NS
MIRKAGAAMPRLPDLAGYSLDELTQLIASANKRAEELRGKRIKELQAELDRLGGDGAASPRGSRSGARGSSRDGRSTARRASTLGRKIAAQFRGPNGEEYSGRGAIPKWARDLGVSERSDLEKFRIR